MASFGTTIVNMRIVLLLCALAVTCLSETLRFENKRYTYSVYVPPSGNGSRPAILLLHGAGGAGRDMLDLWKPLAKAEGLVLIAPNLPRELAFEEVAPRFLHALMDEVMRTNEIDKRRLYVFGYSMGGYLAYDAAMFESTYFAAVGIYANFIYPEYVGILKEAKRRIPIAIYAGVEDELIPIKAVRATRDLLKANGFPVRYREFARRGHDYGAVVHEVNADAWEFFSRAILP